MSLVTLELFVEPLIVHIYITDYIQIIIILQTIFSKYILVLIEYGMLHFSLVSRGETLMGDIWQNADTYVMFY